MTYNRPLRLCIIASLAMLGVSTNVFAADLKSADEDEEPYVLNDGCAAKLSGLGDDVEVLASAAYGGKPTNNKMDKSGHLATEFNVVVNSPHKKVALILSAYEPSVWNVKYTVGTKIEAIVLGGYHKQVLSGVPSNTTVLKHVYDENDCGSFSFYKADSKVISVVSEHYFGKNIDKYYKISANGDVVLGHMNFDANKIMSGVQINVPMVETLGLTAAIAGGIIRPAKQHDIDSWLAGFENKLSDFNRKEAAQRMDPAYVVVKNYAVPLGLFGAKAVTFLVPKGVGLRNAPSGHSMILDLNDYKCIGC